MKSTERRYTYDEALELGIQAGIEYVKQQQAAFSSARHDRRLRNTRLLLKNYRKLAAHAAYACDSITLIAAEDATDVLDELDCISTEELYVQAITRTKVRTNIILEHIGRILKYYEAICSSEGVDKRRRYEIIKALYIEGEKAPTFESVSERFDISTKTVARAVRAAIDDLSVLLFGIDGLKL